jgi:GDP-4-dehydro-6-deoxy-D-mannose reductase
LKKVLITGSEGFTGKHLITYLKKFDQLDLVRLDQKPHSDINFHHIDLLDLKKTISVLKSERPDYIIHLGGINKSNNYQDFFKFNVYTTIHILEAVIQNDLLDTRSLFISSSAVYGQTSAKNVSESSPINPINFYGSSKMSMEIIVKQYSANYNLPTYIVRPFNLVGPGQNPDFVIPHFIIQLLNIKYGKTNPVIKTGNLSSFRDFIDVRDAVAAYWTILSDGSAGEVYNLASGKATEIRVILNNIIDMLDIQTPVTINDQKPSSGDIPILTGDSKKLRNLGWKNHITLDKSISDLISTLEK